MGSSPKRISKDVELYYNLDIGDIIKKFRIIDLKTLQRASGKNKKAITRQTTKLKKQGDIVKIKRGKYTLYVWNSKSNPFIQNSNLLLDFDRDYWNRFVYWSIMQKIKGLNWCNKRLAKMQRKLDSLKNKHNVFDKSIDAYIQKMFFNQYKKIITH